ncbi:hypothetical protein N9Y42_09945 [Mariniblastus sp.]|nr:hypothetical protein [Mariniblastus sp.]
MIDNPYEPPKSETSRENARSLHTVGTYCLIALLCLTLIIPFISFSRMITSPIPKMYFADFVVFAFIWCPTACVTWRRIVKERRKITSD